MGIRLTEKRWLAGLLVSVLWLTAGPPEAYAQAEYPAPALRRVQCRVLFPIGKSAIDLNFEGNRLRLESFIANLKQVMADSNYVVNRVEVVGTASPDGKEEVNIALAGHRAEQLAAYILSRTNLSQHKLKVINGGENWAGLRSMIEASDMPYKEEMLRMMDSHPHDRDARKRAMQYFADSKAWYWLYEHCFPALRTGSSGADENSPLAEGTTAPMTGSGMSFDYEPSPLTKARTGEAAPGETAPGEARPAAQAAGKPQPVTSPRSVGGERPPHPVVSLGTDLMLWGGMLPGFKLGTWTPNLSAEVYFARHWSVRLGGAYSNWNTFSGDKGLFALSGGDLAVRYWFGKPALYRGFYLGLCGQYGQYDVQQKEQGQTGSYYGGGVGAGFLLPLSRHWGLDAELRGCYRSADNLVYDIQGEHNYFNSRQTQGEFVPQLMLNLIYRFNAAGKQP